MALGPTEYWDQGFVVSDDGSGETLVVTTDKTGAQWWGGFLRDPDGRLVVTYG